MDITIAEKMQSLRLPAFPHGISNLLKTLGDNNVEIEAMVAIIETFPSITAKLLSLANSSWSAPQHEITSLHDACTRLGLNVVRSVSIALAIAEPFDTNRCKEFSIQKFWSHTLLLTEAAALLAQQKEQAFVQTARTAAILHALGLVWLADNFPRETGMAIQCSQNADCLNNCLIDAIGIGYDQAGAMLAEALGLPEPLASVMANHRNCQNINDELLCTIYLGDYLIKQFYLGDEQKPTTLEALYLLYNQKNQQDTLNRLESIYPQVIKRAKVLFA